MKPIFNLLLCAFLMLSFTGCTRSDVPVIGVKIYEYTGDYAALAAQWDDIGINTAFISVALAGNDTFRRALRNHRIPVYIIFPVFQDPEALQRDSSIYALTSKGNRAKDDWVEFVCPSRESYRKAKRDELSRLVSTLHPNGVSLDFIRQFVFWEMVYPDRDPGSIDRACYCDSCLRQFTAQYGMSLPDTCRTTVQKAAWINAMHPARYDTFRCGLITSLVKDLAETARQLQPGIMINVHAVPWREGDFGGANIRVAAQDLEQLAAYADFISPMCYSQMLRRDAPWIGSVVADMDKRAPGRVLPSIQVYPYYIDQSFTAEDFRACLREALKPPSRGVVFWSWPMLEKEAARIRVVGEEVKREK
jgi:hypothetical protein